MFRAEICANVPYQNWNYNIVGSLHFHNFNRCLTFAMNYTKQTSNLVRIYVDNKWHSSYCFGKEIWNAL